MPSEHTYLKIAEYITDLLDNRFKIFNTRFGLEPIIGLIPGVGDIISLTFSLYLVWVAVRIKVPNSKIVLMIGNLMVDFLVGLIPVVGDLADFTYKANLKNMKILRESSQATAIDAEVIK